MDENLTRTLEARLEAAPELAATLVQAPRATIRSHEVSPRDVELLARLPRGATSLDGKLTILRTLGEGGMGVVHLATQSSLGRPVAVKTLRAGIGDPHAALRILREAWVTGALEHPNVVPVYDAGVDGQGSPVIVMKRVEGRSWLELMRDDELPRLLGARDLLEANIRVLLAVCNAIHFAHDRGILHRDIKPENVMIGAFGEVYVLDWGIAVSLRHDPEGRLPPVSQATEVVGTPCYMAPEMLLGDPTALSVRTDVYLLGAVCFEIFAGAPPHQGASLQAMIASMLLSEPVFPERFPAEARRICQQAMSRDPGARPASVEEFRTAIEAYLQHRGSRRLAWEARRSLGKLLATIEGGPPGEERSLAVFNLLGESRFGYRAALEAWPGNEAARKDLDRALLAVVDYELAQDDPRAAAALLREVSAIPPGTQARVEAAQQARAQEEERLRRMELDLDPSVGSRTRTLIGTIFGILWTATPLVAWLYEKSGGSIQHGSLLGFSVMFLFLGLAFHQWARETLTKTLLNRQISGTLGVYMILQFCLELGFMLAGWTVQQSLILHVFGWSLTLAILALWVEPWFAASAAVSMISFLLICASPSWLFPLMILDNLVLTVVLFRIWLPRQDLERVRARRRALQSRARGLLLEVFRRDPSEVPSSE